MLHKALTVLMVCCAALAITDANAHALSVGEAKLLPDSSAVAVTSAAVSAVFSDHFYVQDVEFGAGIRVQAPVAGLTRGVAVSVQGALGTTGSMERFISASSVVPGDLSSVTPLVVRGAIAGGADLAVGAGGRGQKGVQDGRGPNNIGRLIALTGWVTHSEPGLFYLDDGSGADDGTGRPGVRVTCKAPAPAGAFATVTGISSCVTSAGLQRPILAVASPEDVAYQGALLSGTAGHLVAESAAFARSSPHPSLDNQTYSFNVSSGAGTVRWRILFTRMELDALDSILIKDSQGDTVKEYNYFDYSYPMFNVWSPWVEGGSGSVDLITDNSFFLTGRYGFSTSTLESVRFTGLAGVTISLSPGGRTVTTGADGGYTFGALATGAYRITPAKLGHAFSPPWMDVAVGDGDVLTYLDFYGEP